MKLESYEDVCKSISSNPDRPFHLFLGNGFSMAYDPNIFSYNALHDFITKIDDPELSRILGVIETKNFELIMQQLDTFSALLDAFKADSEFKKKIDAASNKLKRSLLDAVRELHPEHVFIVPRNESTACSKFIKTFLDTNGHLFSTNYDLLLYWVLMRNKIVEHTDGFGRDLENADEYLQADEQEWSELRWGKHKDSQNVFYLHGALPFFDAGAEIVKEEYDQQSYLLRKIEGRMTRGEYPIFVTAGDGDDKLRHIMHNRYLTHCYETLSGITGSLVTFGFNFGDYDEHIVEAINCAAKYGRKEFPKLLSIYVGVYSDDDRKHIEQMKGDFCCKVHLYDAKTANIWGRK